MAWRAVTQSDVDNTTYTNWIANAKILRKLQIGDLLIDTETSTNNWYQDNLMHVATTSDLVDLTTGNNITDIDLVLDAAIPADTLAEGVIVVDDGSGGDDFYHYSSWTGSTFTLDITDHPTGLVRNYADQTDANISKLRIGLTIWMDSVALDMENVDWNGIGFSLCKSSGTIVTAQYMSTFEKPIMLVPLRGAIVMHDDFWVQGVEHFYIDGDSEYFTGMRSPFQNGNFMKGSFGIQLDNYGYKTTNNIIVEHASDILTTPSYAFEGPSVRIRGVEAYGGFANMRVWQGGNANDEVLAKLFSVIGNYMHDGDSEGLYIGHTGDSENNNPRIESVIVGNNLFARRGTESVQIQSFLNNSVEHRIFNNVILGSAADWIRPFQAYQSGTQQYVFGDGNVIIENNMVESYIDNIYGLFGTSNGSAVGDISIRRNYQSNGWGVAYNHGTQSTLSEQVRFLIEQNWHILPHSRSADRRKHFTPPTFDYVWGAGEGTVKMLYKHIETEAGFPAGIFENVQTDEIVAPTNIVKSLRSAASYQNAGLSYNKDSGDGGGYDFLGVWDARVWPVITVADSIDSPTNPGTARFTMTGAHELSDGDTVIITDSTVYTNGTYDSDVTRIDSGTMEITGIPYTPRATFACTGGGSATNLQDSVNDFTAMGIVTNPADLLRNTTDGSECSVVSVDDANNITTTALTGGSDNTWTSGDTYEIIERYRMYIGSPMEYLVGEIVSQMDWTLGSYPNHPGVKFYKCKLQHSAAALSENPETETSRWDLIRWDVNGVRSDKAGYTGTPDPTTGGWFPPDNALLIPNDQWNKKGVGLLTNPSPTDATYYKWYYADDAIGTNKKEILGAKTASFDLTDPRWDWIAVQANKFIVGSITPVNSNGKIGVETFATGISISQALWDEIAALGDWVLAPFQTTAGDGGAYEESGLTTLVSDGSGVYGIKGFGNNVPSISNIIRESYTDPSSADIWYSSEGALPIYKDRGGFDKYIRIRNGKNIRFATDPGSLSPSITRPYHHIEMMRIYPCPGNETTSFWKWQDGNKMRYLKGSLDSVIDANLFKDQLWEIKFDGSGNWVIYVDGVEDTSGSGEAPSSNEWYIGSNGHPLEHQFRFAMWKFGTFSAADLTTIRNNAASIWPAVVPSYPALDTIHVLTSSQWETVENVWDLTRNKTVVFSGGNGIEGTHDYQWYYWSSADTGTFPIGNKLDEHLALSGATSSTLDRDSYSTEIPIPGNGDIWVMCVITPKDSLGAEGEKIVTSWIQDNTA